MHSVGQVCALVHCVGQVCALVECVEFGEKGKSSIRRLSYLF